MPTLVLTVFACLIALVPVSVIASDKVSRTEIDGARRPLGGGHEHKQ